uniref:Uncharacterized protein n=1 Tax=Acrobeloides nanus TaxID=290746 RepID=A0A914CF96_9BILA
RYYGASQVTADQSTANLKYLSSRQALADIADFIPAMNTKFNLQGAKWVTFGGSYSGALAAWSRALYPNLIYGAVGSSGPVQAVVDFVGYLEVVSNDLNTYDTACGDSLKNALAQIPQLLTTAQGRQQLFKGFHWYVKQCALIYGSQFDNTTVYSNINKTNGFYHGQNGYNATRIVLPNGTNDPWHVLGVLNAPNSQAYPVIINGTAHCADMYGDSSTDPASLTAARTQIRSIVNSWFKS